MTLTFGPFTLYRQDRRVDGPEGAVDLSARAFDLLCVLLDRAGEIVSKDAIFDAVWPGVVVEENTLQVHISALRKALGSDMIATVHGRGYRYTGPAPEPRDAAEAKPVKGPVIVVLPFANLGGDLDQQYFTDGITQDIIDRLTRFRMLTVIGHDLLFVLREATPTVDTIRTPADFILSGNIRRSESRIRIAVRLTDASTQAALWAQHFDRPLADLFAVQDELADLVAAKVARHLEIEITGRTSRRHPGSLSAYEDMLIGHWHLAKQTRDGNATAIASYRRALGADPANGEVLGWLAQALMDRYILEFDHDSIQEGVTRAAEAIRHDPSSARAHMFLGYGQLWVGGLDLAKASLDHAMTLNPGDPYVSMTCAVAAVFDGQLDQARHLLERGLRLDPVPPPWFPEHAASIAFLEGRYADAIAGYENLPEYAWFMMYLLACCGQLGLQEKASAILNRLAADGRAYDFIAAAKCEPYRNPEPRAALIKGWNLRLWRRDSR